MRRFSGLILSASLLVSAGSLAAQDSQTLADIRQELTVLNVEIQRLKRELVTTGAPETNVAGDSVLERIGAIEAELQRLTSQTEQLQFRVDSIVQDGTNRIGDLEFRLVELEGGDVSQLGETSTLGGGSVAPVPSAPEAGSGSGELAVSEQAEFDTAAAALDAQDYAGAVDLFTRFEQSYPGSPLAAEAHLKRGKALDGLGDTREAARAYLAAFTGNASGPIAPDALLALGSALGRLGQTSQACITLSEVASRFPSSAAVASAQQEMSALGCS